MNISSNGAISGAHTALIRHDITAHDVANIGTPGYEQVTPHQTDMMPTGTRISHLAKTPNSNPALSNTDLATEAVEQKTNTVNLKANLSVIKAKDEMVGEVIDLLG